MSRLNSLTRIALMAALTVICAQLIIPLPFTPIPFSLSIVAVLLCGTLLDKRSALIAQLVYLLLGLVGLPVFSGFSGGIGKILGPTGGYIISYLFVAYLTALLLEIWGRRDLLTLSVSMGAGLAVCYLFGSAWLAYMSNISFVAALGAGVLPFVVFDLVKIFLAALLTIALQKPLAALRAR